MDLPRAFLIHSVAQEKVQDVSGMAQWRLLLRLQLQRW